MFDETKSQMIDQGRTVGLYLGVTLYDYGILDKVLGTTTTVKIRIYVLKNKNGVEPNIKIK